MEQFIFLENYNGKLSDHEALQRYVGSHPILDKQDLFNKQNPEKGHEQAQRDVLNVLGIGIDSQEGDLSTREQQLTENVRQHQREHNEFNQMNQYPQEAVANLRKQ